MYLQPELGCDAIESSSMFPATEKYKVRRFPWAISTSRTSSTLVMSTSRHRTSRQMQKLTFICKVHRFTTHKKSLPFLSDEETLLENNSRYWNIKVRKAPLTFNKLEKFFGNERLTMRERIAYQTIFRRNVIFYHHRQIKNVLWFVPYWKRICSNEWRD